ncbi:MAG: glycosyltransferase family 4 protein [Ruminococcaceae bacterium]|nr:glycosyltransferase family 4 protein [Oscillospiraceae bacterium]
MKIFVASWFYVPVTTSEALVTYKLLANSENEYVVCSAKSTKWSYKKDSAMKSDNIRQYIIDTDDFDEFVEKTVETYKELCKTEKFDAIMTRSLPPESQYVGFKIRAIDPTIPWIASLADPIGNNPYETKFYFLENRHKLVRKLYFHAPHFFLGRIAPLIKRPAFQKLSQLYKLERKVLDEADIIITPTQAQAEYIMNDVAVREKKSLVVPHSYDKRLYSSEVERKNEKFVFTFIGQSDNYRSVEPIVRGVLLLKDVNPEMLKRIKVRLVGNIPDAIKNMVYVFFLQDVISIEEPCDYFRSLQIMQESDCLLHIDAPFFDILPNGSIFFAAKIADYLGAGKPILGLTDKLSPAGKIITSCGGVCCYSEAYDVAKQFVAMANGTGCFKPEEAEKYAAQNVAKDFDDNLKRRLLK